MLLGGLYPDNPYESTPAVLTIYQYFTNQPSCKLGEKAGGKAISFMTVIRGQVYTR